ncbi:MAG TPA: hypothetical protein VGO55_14705 [Allosphingosinicella sp.]|jgi:hypothetical protein|nr:hypothetical protein [Allosphingosinicella sp.]
MNERYWIGRKRAAMAMARAATSAEARLIHYDMAGRYSVNAAFDAPFLLPIEGPATPGERLALDRSLPALPRPRPTYRPRRGPSGPAEGGR